MSSAPQPAININMGKQNKVWLTVCLTVGLTITGWVVNSESVMPNLMGFYLRIRYGRELAEKMATKSPEQIRLEALERQMEADREYQRQAEENLAEQKKVIEGMKADSAQRLAAEQQKSRDQQAELAKLREEQHKREANKPQEDKERLLQSGLDDGDATVQELRRKIKALEDAMPRLKLRVDDDYRKSIYSDESTRIGQEDGQRARDSLRFSRMALDGANEKLKQLKDKLRIEELAADARIINQ